MSSELRRGFSRIASNYGRFIATTLLILWLTQLLLQGVGKEAVGIIGLLGATAGITLLITEVTRRSMIRDVSAAYHTNDRAYFVRVYNSALFLAVIAATLTLLGYMAVIFILPWMKISDEMLRAAQWYALTRGIVAFVTICATPIRNIYLVQERMLVYNTMRTLETASRTAAAGWIAWFGHFDPATGLMWYGWLSAALMLAVIIPFALAVILSDSRFIPNPFRAGNAQLSIVWNDSKGNLAASFGSQAHVNIGNVIMNLAFGAEVGNLIWSVGTRLPLALSEVVMSISGGLDAVSARISTFDGDEAIRHLTRHATRLFGVAAFPSLIGVFMLGHPFLYIWLGSEFVGDTKTLDQIWVILQITSIGIIFRAIAEGWFLIAYGAGHIHRFAPLVLISTLANPILAILLLYAMPEESRYYGPAYAMTAAIVVFHLGLAARALAHSIGISYFNLLSPLLKPFIVSLIPLPILIYFSYHFGVTGWNIPWWGIAALAYAVPYLPLTYFLVLDRDERLRFQKAIRRRLPRNVESYDTPLGDE